MRVCVHVMYNNIYIYIYTYTHTCIHHVYIYIMYMYVYTYRMPRDSDKCTTRRARVTRSPRPFRSLLLAPPTYPCSCEHGIQSSVTDKTTNSLSQRLVNKLFSFCVTHFHLAFTSCITASTTTVSKSSDAASTSCITAFTSWLLLFTSFYFFY